MPRNIMPGLLLPTYMTWVKLESLFEYKMAIIIAALPTAHYLVEGWGWGGSISKIVRALVRGRFAFSSCNQHTDTHYISPSPLTTKVAHSPLNGVRVLFRRAGEK